MLNDMKIYTLSWSCDVNAGFWLDAGKNYRLECHYMCICYAEWWSTAIYIYFMMNNRFDELEDLRVCIGDIFNFFLRKCLNFISNILRMNLHFFYLWTFKSIEVSFYRLDGFVGNDKHIVFRRKCYTKIFKVLNWFAATRFVLNCTAINCL